MNNPPSENTSSEVAKGVARPKGTIANAGWNSLSTIWSIGISFLLTPVLIHNLGAAQYGILLIIWSVNGLLSITSFGMGEGTLRYVAHYCGDRDLSGVNRILGSTLSFFVVLFIAVSGIIFAGSSVFVEWLNIPAEQRPLVSWLLCASAIVFSLVTITNTIGAVPRALQRYDVVSKIGMAVSVFRGIGYILLALSGFGILQIVLWDLAVSLLSLWLVARAVRDVLPGVNLLPSFSFGGLREIVGYSLFSFLTWAFHTIHRESGKLLVSRFLGASPVASLGAPDNISQRIHMLVASGAESLLPRFSANRDPKLAEDLFWTSTWFALTVSLVLFIPFFVLVPDFLALWISPEFARQSGVVGQVLALYMISQGAFAPAATYFRGIGKPWFVTATILAALIITVSTSIFTIPKYGVEGAGYAYLIGSVAPLVGIIFGGLYAFGRSSVGRLLTSVLAPVVGALFACVMSLIIRGTSATLGWFGLIAYATLFTSMTGVIVFATDWMIGGEHSPSRQLLERVGKSRHFAGLSKAISLKRSAVSE